MCQCDEFTRLFIKECLNIDIESSKYNGKLQSIHHIDKYEVVYNIHEKIEEMPDKYEDYGLYLYDLGKAIIPPV